MKTVQARTSEIQRLQKTLETAGIKLSSVLSDVTGASARAMIEALISGERRGHGLRSSYGAVAVSIRPCRRQMRISAGWGYGRIKKAMMGSMQHYVHDDAGYLAWIFGHPGGFVINTYTRPSRAYLRLHQATCPTISRLQPGARTFTSGEYSKICGSRAELEEHAHRLGGTAQPCPLCL